MTVPSATTTGRGGRALGAMLLAVSLLAVPLTLISVMGLGGMFRFGSPVEAVGATLVVLTHLVVTVLLPVAHLRARRTTGAGRAWWWTVPAMVYAVGGVAYGAGMAFDGWQESRNDCRQLFCDAGLYMGPVVVGFFMIVAAAVAFQARLLRRPLQS